MTVLHRHAHAARWVALHEMGHARWTPRSAQPAKVAKTNAPATVRDVQIMEDCRVFSMLADAGLAGIPRETAEDIQRIAAQWSQHLAPDVLLERYALTVLQSLAVPITNRPTLDSTPAGRETKLLRHHLTTNAAAEAEASRLDVEDAKRAIARILDKAEEIAVECAGMLRPRRRPRHPQARLPFRCVGPAAAHLRRRLENAKEQPPPIPGAGKRYSRPGLDWGTLMPLPPLPMTPHQSATAAQRRTLAVPAGARLGAIRRALTDGRCYRRTVRRDAKGGTVLIDTSGSMHLDPATIHALLARLPAATVAIYSGAGTKGAVSIIAAKGRVASADAIAERITRVGGGNVVDGPALQWLGQQAEPRLWVCDGIVTGCGDSATQHLDEEAAAIAHRHNIQRVDDMAALLDVTEATR